jgi:hypothetical protein
MPPGAELPGTVMEPLAYETPASLTADAVVIRAGRSSAVAFVFWGGVIAAAPFVIDGQPRLTGILMGLAAMALGCWRLIDRKPRLILNAAELSCPPFRLSIPWPHVADALVAYHEGASLLIIKLLDNAPAPSHRPDVPQPPEATDRDVVLPVAGLELSPEQVIALVRKHIARAQPRPQSDR